MRFTPAAIILAFLPLCALAQDNVVDVVDKNNKDDDTDLELLSEAKSIEKDSPFLPNHWDLEMVVENQDEAEYKDDEWNNEDEEDEDEDEEDQAMQDHEDESDEVNLVIDEEVHVAEPVRILGMMKKMCEFIVI